MKKKCFNQHTSAVLLSASLLLFTNACAQETTISAVEASAPVNASDAVAQHAQPQKSAKKWQWNTIAQGLSHPWSLAILPDGDFLVTERSGSLHHIDVNGRKSKPLTGLPAMAVDGQGGLLDIALAADFKHSRKLFFCFSEPSAHGSSNSTALASANLSTDMRRLENVKIMFSQQPKVDSSAHFGCRIVLKNKQLFLTLGDRYSRMQDAQTLNNHLGKIVRLNQDGSVPADNPFVGQTNKLAEIYSYGHRNVQGAALAADGQLWTHEHGPQGGDEINIIQAAANYGWPVITYGEQYGGGKIGAGISAQEGMKQPLYYWQPSIAPSGMIFVSSNRYGDDWNGNLLVGSLKFSYLARITLDSKQKIVREDKINVGERVRDVRQAPDGFIYVLTDSANGKLLRLQPYLQP